MSHTNKARSKLLGRIRRIRGQIEGVGRALEADADCSDVLHQVASVHGALKGLMAAILEDHIREHVGGSSVAAKERHAAIEDLVDVIRSYMK